MIRIYILFIASLVLISCDTHPTIEITRDSIYNSYWGDKSHNGAAVSIWRVIPNKNVKSINIDFLSGFEIHNNVKRDSTFRYVSSYGKNVDPDTIFFNKKNKGIIWYSEDDISKEIDIIGSLELDTWYRFDTYLYHAWVYYIYVDKQGEVHTWAINPVNI